ncbi:MAG TPA: membrane dipeptidase [Solirubrobacteraceae bacterium]|nr:membrane dipeptidase [Solirubrobacteraceae bacterium]
MLADMHVHYPMHVVHDVTPETAVKRMRKLRGGPRLRDKFRALVIRVLAAFINMRYPWSDYRVSVDELTAGGVGFVWSALYRPFEEMDLSKPYGAPPDSAYYPQLVGDLADVEAEVAARDPAVIRIAHDRAELDAGLAAGGITLVHAVEGGFHLGDTEEEVADNVADLARRGVAYITLAHLFYRGVATNAPALPFLPDALYRRLFPQPAEGPVTDRGEAAVRAMVAHGVLVDLSHADEPAFARVIQLLDEELDPRCEVPIISSHAGYRFGGQHYMHSEQQVLEFKRRDGVIGLIMAQHQLCDGLRRTKTIERSFEVIAKHIDRIHEITGSHRHVALGSDFDGFIKPTMGGLEKAGDFAQLERRLRERYGDEAAEMLCWRNAQRVLQAVWR